MTFFTRKLVGRFTWAGTLSIVKEGIIFGIYAGLYYVWIRRFVPFQGLRKGLAFGGMLLVTFGILLVIEEEGNYFQPRIVGSALFALLPLVFGVIAVSVADRFIATVPPRDGHPRRTQIGKRTLVGATVLGSIAVFATLIGDLIQSF